MNLFSRFFLFICGVLIWAFALVGSAMIAAKGCSGAAFFVAALLSYLCGTIAAYFITQSGARIFASFTVWLNIIVSLTMLCLCWILLVSSLLTLPAPVPNVLALDAAIDWYIALATSLDIVLVYALGGGALLVTITLLSMLLRGRNSTAVE